MGVILKQLGILTACVGRQEGGNTELKPLTLDNLEIVQSKGLSSTLNIAVMNLQTYVLQKHLAEKKKEKDCKRKFECHQHVNGFTQEQKMK